MTEAFYSFDVAIISIIALIIGTAIGRLLSRPQKGEKGDTGPQGPQGNIGERGLPGEPGRLEPHTHRIRDIAGLAEHLGIHDKNELTTRMKAFVRDSVINGDMTPSAERVMYRIIKEYEEKP